MSGHCGMLMASGGSPGPMSRQAYLILGGFEHAGAHSAERVLTLRSAHRDTEEVPDRRGQRHGQAAADADTQRGPAA